MFKKKIRIIFIMFLVCIYFMFFISFTNEVYASNTNEEKIYCEVSIDDNFANDCIMVVMNEQSSNYDKTYTNDDFNEIDCKRVEILNREAKLVASGLKRNSLVKEEGYITVIKIDLKESSKKTVLYAIQKLMEREDMIYVGPNYEIESFDMSYNDIMKDEQRAIESIKLQKAWDFTTGTKDVLVGVLDTGIDGSH